MFLAVSESKVFDSITFSLSALLVVALALVHLYCGKLRFLDRIPRSRWLSVASGVSVAYVFVHLLPDLNARQEVFTKINALNFVENHVYLIALFGLTIFYGLERVAKRSRQYNAKSGKDIAEIGVFWLHIASFALYNGLIGYLLLHREEPGIYSLLFFSIAMGLHFVVNDYGLRQHHKHIYHKIGRWILAAAIIVGWVIGTRVNISEAAIAVLFAFLAGGIILNVLKEELPEERESRFWAFALGAIAYAVLLLVTL
ncbi:hypothetical protein IQ238_00940 [Pleurocapsales cyanobacterium LEGE 06147]|nr:hypothetical protein [Pleurocapsales cyanobacterium LEGE 06147]